VPNAVVHFEVSAPDDGPLLDFYGKVFGWRLHDFPGGGYTLIDTRGGGGINGGIGKSQAGEPWSTFYVETDDLQAALDQATALGGRTVMPVTDFGGAVTTAMFADPDGLLVGLVLAAEPAGDQAAPSAGLGEPVDWFEVMGSDAARTQQFYAQLFGWTIDDAGFPGYAVSNPGAGRGIYGGLGGGLESRWATIYAGVADFDQTLSRVESLGGSRILDPSVPALKSASRAARYGSADDMKTGAFRDPAGNVFGIYQRVG
jgi:predicted enzyme related to lactoylglutathione lyase